MRKIFILILLIMPVSLLSQNFNGGLNLGMNTSQIDGDAYWGYHRIGPFVGAFVNTYFTEYIGMQLELNYVNKGASKRNEIGDPAYYRIKLNYVELPVVALYKLIDKVRINAGITYGVLIKAKEDLSGTGFREPEPAFDKSDLSMLVGAEYFFTEKWSIYGRFTYSILPIREHPGKKTHFLDRGQMNNNISIALRYYF